MDVSDGCATESAFRFLVWGFWRSGGDRTDEAAEECDAADDSFCVGISRVRGIDADDSFCVGLSRVRGIDADEGFSHRRRGVE